MDSSAPIVEVHNGMLVARDDLYPGGTKARFIPDLLEPNAEYVYAGPAEGGAAFALATVAAASNMRVTLVYAARAVLHRRQKQAQRLGAKLLLVRPGYLTVVRARAREYCARTGARLLPWGLDTEIAAATISETARNTAAAVGQVDEVWCAAGSGVLLRGLADGFPGARIYGVRVGHELTREQAGRATILGQPLRFDQQAHQRPPFSSDPHYEAKAWQVAVARHKGLALFWNVLGE